MTSPSQADGPKSLGGAVRGGLRRLVDPRRLIAGMGTPLRVLTLTYIGAGGLAGAAAVGVLLMTPAGGAVQQAVEPARDLAQRIVPAAFLPSFEVDRQRPIVGSPAGAVTAGVPAAVVDAPRPRVGSARDASNLRGVDVSTAVATGFRLASADEQSATPGLTDADSVPSIQAVSAGNPASRPGAGSQPAPTTALGGVAPLARDVSVADAAGGGATSGTPALVPQTGADPTSPGGPAFPMTAGAGVAAGPSVDGRPATAAGPDVVARPAVGAPTDAGRMRSAGDTSLGDTSAGLDAASVGNPTPQASLVRASDVDAPQRTSMGAFSGVATPLPEPAHRPDRPGGSQSGPVSSTAPTAASAPVGPATEPTPGAPTAEPTPLPIAIGPPTSVPTPLPTVVVQTPAPTGSQPTQSPTSQATPAPTSEPTPVPTAQRTPIAPTSTAVPPTTPTATRPRTPTPQPKSTPATPGPTQRPTARPSSQPTARPTSAPTARATAVSSQAPTPKPTHKPTVKDVATASARPS